MSSTFWLIYSFTVRPVTHHQIVERIQLNWPRGRHRAPLYNSRFVSSTKFRMCCSNFLDPCCLQCTPDRRWNPFWCQNKFWVFDYQFDLILILSIRRCENELGWNVFRYIIIDLIWHAIRRVLNLPIRWRNIEFSTRFQCISILSIKQFIHPHFLHGILSIQHNWP